MKKPNLTLIITDYSKHIIQGMKYNLCYFNPLCCPIERLLMYTKVQELMLFKQFSTYTNVIYRLCKLVTYQRHEYS